MKNKYKYIITFITLSVCVTALSKEKILSCKGSKNHKEFNLKFHKDENNLTSIYINQKVVFLGELTWPNDRFANIQLFHLSHKSDESSFGFSLIQNNITEKKSVKSPIIANIYFHLHYPSALKLNLQNFECSEQMKKNNIEDSEMNFEQDISGDYLINHEYLLNKILKFKLVDLDDLQSCFCQINKSDFLPKYNEMGKYLFKQVPLSILKLEIKPSELEILKDELFLTNSLLEENISMRISSDNHGELKIQSQNGHCQLNDPRKDGMYVSVINGIHGVEVYSDLN